MTTDCGVPSGQFPTLKPVLVHVRVSAPTSPEMLPAPVHCPEPLPDPSNEMDPENEPTPVKPLIAPAHAGGLVAQAPSTQLAA
jgi:hypothetical protein